jgi:hypothetical protein
MFDVEVDAKYIQGMLNNPDIQPNAAMNRWILGILLFNFNLVHVAGKDHNGPDGLSRQRNAKGDMEEREGEAEEWIDDMLDMGVWVNSWWEQGIQMCEGGTTMGGKCKERDKKGRRRKGRTGEDGKVKGEVGNAGEWQGENGKRRQVEGEERGYDMAKGNDVNERRGKGTKGENGRWERKEEGEWGGRRREERDRRGWEREGGGQDE